MLREPSTSEAPHTSYVDALALLKGFAAAILTALGVSLLVGIGVSVFAYFAILLGVCRPLLVLLQLLVWLVGQLPDLVGGYVAAAAARREPLRHGLVMGVILLICSCLLHLLPGDGSGWVGILTLLLVVPLAVLGSHLSRIGVVA